MKRLWLKEGLALSVILIMVLLYYNHEKVKTISYMEDRLRTVMQKETGGRGGENPVFSPETLLDKAVRLTAEAEAPVIPVVSSTTTTTEAPPTTTTTEATIPTCVPKKNMVYLKTHKTASSAVQNIIMRRAIKEKLWILEPFNQHDFLYPSRKFSCRHALFCGPPKGLESSRSGNKTLQRAEQVKTPASTSTKIPSVVAANITKKKDRKEGLESSRSGNKTLQRAEQVKTPASTSTKIPSVVAANIAKKKDRKEGLESSRSGNKTLQRAEQVKTPASTSTKIPSVVAANIAKKKDWKEVSVPTNIICHHTRLDYEQMKAAMPNDSVWVASVREPLSLYRSTIAYLRPDVPAFQRISPHDPIELWYDQAQHFINSSKHGKYDHFTKNHMFFDFGFDTARDQDMEYVENATQQLDDIFDLVLVADHFDESMVLLSDLLCWPIEEFACLTLNARKDESKNISEEVEERTRRKVRDWNKADAMLFDHFNASLWKKIEAFGMDRMAKQLDILHNETERLSKSCLAKTDPVELSKLSAKEKVGVYQPRGVKLMGYKLRDNVEPVCRHLVQPENSFSKEVFKLQYKRMKLLGL